MHLLRRESGVGPVGAGSTLDSVVICRSRKIDRGAAAVEMAIVLPILLLFMFAIIDFGRMLNKQITVTAAAHEGARVLSVGGTDVDATERAEAIAGDSITPVTLQPCAIATGATADAQMTITYDFEFITPVGLVGGGFDGKATLTGRGVTPCS